MTSVQMIDYTAIAPPVVVALGAVVALVVDLVVGPTRRLAPVIGLGVVLLAGALLWPLRDGTRQTFCVPDGCSYVADQLAVLVQFIVLAGAAVVLLLSLAERRMPTGEYAFLLLSSVSGALVVAAARDLATLVIALEVVSLPSFALVALRRDAVGAQAALTAFLQSTVATAVTLLGVAFVYVGSGTVFLQRMPEALAESGFAKPLIQAGILLTLAAPLFKLAAVPIHSWAPDTYTGAPLSIAGYLSLVSKAAGLVALVALTFGGFAGEASTWAPVLAVVAAATMVIGNLGALRQSRVVRLLAWSSVGQVGYVLVPLACAGRVDPRLAVSASVAYLAAYGAMNLGAFAVVAAAVPGGMTPGELALDDLRGLARTRPFLGLSLAFFLACLAGLPPGLIGLVAKVRVFEIPVRAGLGWLAVLMGVATVIGLAYYVRFAALLFAEPSPGAVLAKRPPVSLAVGLTLGVTVVTSVLPGVIVGLLSP